MENKIDKERKIREREIWLQKINERALKEKKFDKNIKKNAEATNTKEKQVFLIAIYLHMYQKGIQKIELKLYFDQKFICFT